MVYELLKFGGQGRLQSRQLAGLRMFEL